MKKALLLLVISIGFVEIYSGYELTKKKATQEMMAEIEAELVLEAEAAAAEAARMAEIEAEMARQAALEAFQQKLADEKAAAAASTAAYQAKIAGEEVIGVVEVEGEEVVVTVAAHEACKYALNLTESNIELFKTALAGGYLFNVGPQTDNGTEFTANRWDEYANCVSNYVNPF